MRYRWICLRADNTAGLFDTSSRDGIVTYPDFEYIKKECHMEMAEVVHFRLDKESPWFIMLVDEEGKLRDKPINPVASYLYGSKTDFIVGDVAIIGDGRGDGELYYLEDHESNNLWLDIVGLVNKHTSV